MLVHWEGENSVIIGTSLHNCSHGNGTSVDQSRQDTKWQQHEVWKYTTTTSRGCGLGGVLNYYMLYVCVDECLVVIGIQTNPRSAVTNVTANANATDSANLRCGNRI